jgi:hypothetical protein
MMKIGLLISVPALAATLSACNSSTTPTTTTTTTADTTAPAPTLASITITGEAELTGLRERSQLNATATETDDTTLDVTLLATWRSSNVGIAAVSAAGVVTTVSPGTATVTATYAGVVGSFDINVSGRSTTLQANVVGSDGDRGTLTLTVAAALSPTSASTSAQVSGAVRFQSGAVTALAGFFQAQTGAFTVSGTELPFTFTGTVVNGALSGSYTGPNSVTGTFASS